MPPVDAQHEGVTDALQAGNPARSRRPHRGLWLLLVVPAMVTLTVAFVVPMIRLIWVSVSTPSLGFDNYSILFADRIATVIIGRTLTMAALVTAVCLVVGYPYAYVATIVTPRWRTVMLGLALMPLWTSLMARSFAWVVLLQDQGILNAALSSIGVGPVRLLGTTAGVSLAMAQVMLPFMILPIYSTLKGIDKRLVRAAQGLGARPLTAFRRIYLPLSLPGVLAGSTLVMILSLGFYVTPALVGSPSQSMLAQFIAVRVNQLLDFGGAGALAMILLTIALVLVALASRITTPSELIGSAARDDGRAR